MSKGLGDMVEQVMKITGIKKIVEYFFQDCGCYERQEWLNKQSKRFKKEFDCLTKPEFLYLSGIFELKQKDFDILEQQKQERELFGRAVAQAQLDKVLELDREKIIEIISKGHDRDGMYNSSRIADQIIATWKGE